MKKYLSIQVIAVLISVVLCACGTSRDTVTSIDLDSMQFYLDGVIYTLPCVYGELVENGWMIDDDQQTLGPNNLKMFEVRKDDSTLFLQLVNFTSYNAISLEECYVMSIWQAAEYAYPLNGEGAATIVNAGNSLLAAGIRNGDSYGRMIELYGEPSSVRKSAAYSHTAFYPNMEITYNPMNGQINLVSLKSNLPPDITMGPKIVGTVPDYVLQYSPPEAFVEIGNREIFKMEDDFYRMPIPLWYLKKNGFSLANTEEQSLLYSHVEWNQVIGAQSQLTITMRSKNGVLLNVTIKNYMETAQEVINCVAIGIMGEGLNFELSGGIDESIHYENLIALYEQNNLRLSVDKKRSIVDHGYQVRDNRVQFFFSNGISEPMTRFNIRYSFEHLPSK